MEVSYGKEPFDLRLLCLRLCRNLWKILAVTAVGTLLSGGGYYVKNVLLQPDPGYAASSTYKVEYKENPNAAGAYYINEATWNTLLHTGEFLDGVEMHLQEAADNGDAEAAEVLAMGRDAWSDGLSATLPSDFSIPVTQATTQHPEMSVALAHATEAAMCEEFAESMVEIDKIKVLDPGNRADAVVPDVRPVRAVILAAVVSLFFAVVLFSLVEIAQDSIWLPATLRRRYGLNSLGTVESVGFAENLAYTLAKTYDKKCLDESGRNGTEGGKKDSICRVAVCGALPEADPREITETLQKLAKTEEAGKMGETAVEYTAVPSPLLCPESGATLREADGILLAVPAGKRVGKQLEAVLEYLKTQDCSVDGAFLWNADERLIRSYYFLPGAIQTEAEQYGGVQG